MRTTLTLEPDLYTQLQTLARQSGLSFKELVNRTLRKGLAKGSEPAAPLPPFVVTPFSLELRPGIDPNRLNQLYDELEIEDFLRKEAKQE
ncbi:MAG: CopG family transcriptional regulator [Thermoanaerobaculia bacterium]|nr:CopG family transcriptional regulator [Thermoanaerobaculia bacterium]